MMNPALWAAPAVIVAAIIVGWAAETAQLYIGQGLALAILAWLQTSPEFAVEAVIAWQQKLSSMTANLTGSLRLLVGFGWPLIYFTNAFFSKKKGWPVIRLPSSNGLEVLTLLLATLYFCLVWLKASLTIADSYFLIGIYFLYLYLLTKMPKGLKEETEDLPPVGQAIAKLRSPWARGLALFLLFGIGAFLLKISTPPFLRGLEILAASYGISSFYFIQWCAPFVSEFPEKVTAFQWARTKNKAPMAVINMVSSNIVQWTLMAGMIPVIYSFSVREVTPILLGDLQRREIAVTILQSFLSILFLMDLELKFWDALGLLILWAVQFFVPTLRGTVMLAYGAWSVWEVFYLVRHGKLTYALEEWRRLRGR